MRLPVGTMGAVGTMVAMRTVVSILSTFMMFVEFLSVHQRHTIIINGRSGIIFMSENA
jgi:flagellar basal body P-ring protein FlgI